VEIASVVETLSGCGIIEHSNCMLAGKDNCGNGGEKGKLKEIKEPALELNQVG